VFANHDILFLHYRVIRDTLISAVKVVRDKRHLRELCNLQESSVYVTEHCF
jgi:hypothetical protein